MKNIKHRCITTKNIYKVAELDRVAKAFCAVILQRTTVLLHCMLTIKHQTSWKQKQKSLFVIGLEYDRISLSSLHFLSTLYMYLNTFFKTYFD
jgi:hypothetical protein